jgi:4-amino-4-deoxy-L-arabinose transferase-like glycosyltransferase
LTGQLISIFFCLLAVFPLYFIGKSLFGPQAAFWATILYLINPLMLYSSVDVLKEGLIIFLFFSSVYCSLRMLREGKSIWLIWTLIFVSLGALGRMSNLVVLFVLGLWVGYSGLRKILVDRKPAYRYWWIIFLVIGIMAAFALTGILEWEFIVEKKSYVRILRFFKHWFVNDVPSLSRLGEGIFTMISRFIEKACVLAFLLALFGLGWRIKTKKFSAEETYLVLVMVGLFTIVFVMALPLFAATERYQLPNIFLLYLWAGFGFIKIRELIDTRFTKYRKATAVISVMIILGMMLPLCLKPQRLDKIGRKEVGLWLRERSVAPPGIMTNIPRAVYYAGGKYLSFPDEFIPKRIIRQGKSEEADYLIMEWKGREDLDTIVYFEKKWDLTLVHRYPYGDKGRVIYVYKVSKKMNRPRKES